MQDTKVRNQRLDKYMQWTSEFAIVTPLLLFRVYYRWMDFRTKALINGVQFMVWRKQFGSYYNEQPYKWSWTWNWKWKSYESFEDGN